MSRWFGFMCNDPERVACALYPAREALVEERASDGWGLASYQGGEVLLQRHPKPAPMLDLYAHSSILRTDYLVGHIRGPGTPAKLDNTQPYRFRQWVFAQSGKVDAFEQVREKLLDAVPDFLRRNIRGQNDSEHMFHVFLSFLHDGGKLDDSNIRVNEAAGALGASVALSRSLVEAVGGQVDGVSAVTTNGRMMIALRTTGRMWVRQVNGIPSCPVCREKPELRVDKRRTVHEHVRATIILSDVDKPNTEGWEEVPPHSVVGISRDLNRTIVPIRPT
jgi:predicted glutamine amidotransferase